MIGYKTWLTFLLSHLNLLPLLAAAVEGVVSATGVVAKWEAVKAVGDILAPVIGELTGPQAASTETEAELESKVVAAFAAQPATAEGVHAAAINWDGSRLRTIWKFLEPLLPLLIALIPKG